MTAFSSPDDEITGSEDIIRLEDVKARISRLESADCYGDLEGTDGCDSSMECPSCYGEAEEELAHLKQLLTDLGDIGDDSCLIHDDYLVEYAQNDSEMDDDDPLWFYVDWGRVAQDRYRNNMQSVRFRGSIYSVEVR